MKKNKHIEKVPFDYADVAVALSPLLHALGHRARIHILLHLARYHGCNAHSISNRLPLAKSTVSVHLSKLKEAGLISSEDDGNSVKYMLNSAGYDLLQKRLQEMFDVIEKWKQHQVKCCNELVH